MRQDVLASNVWKSYALRVLMGGFSLSIPTVVLLWQENGVPVRDGMMMQAIFAVLLALFDVPTGYAADVFGRKRAIVAASVSVLIGAIFYSVAENFNAFLCGEIFLAFGFSLASGADQALVYDSLLELDRKDQYERIWGRGTAMSLVAMSAFSAVGGVAATWSLRLPCHLQVVCGAALIGVSLLLAEPGRSGEMDAKRRVSLRDVARVSVQGGARIRWLLMYPPVLFALMQGTFWLYQPYFVLSGLSRGLFGVVYALFNLVAAWAAQCAYRADGMMNERSRMLLLPAMIAGSYLLAGSIVMQASFVFIVLLQLVRGYSQVVFSDQLNREIPCHVRASVLSIQSMAGRLMYAGLLPIAAWLAGSAGVAGAFLVAGAATLAVGCILVMGFYAPEKKL